MKGILRRSTSETHTPTVKSRFLSLAGCALVLALGSGCQVFNDLGDAWKEYEEEHQDDPSPYPGASGVDVFNCTVNDAPASIGYPFTVFFRLNDDPNWQPANPLQIAALSPGQSCTSTPIEELVASGTVTHIDFTQAGVWHIRWIVVGLPPEHGGSGICNSNDGTGTDCAPGEVKDTEFTYDATAGVKPLYL